MSHHPLSGAVLAVLLAVFLAAGGAMPAQAQDPTDQSSLWPGAAISRLEKKGYSELRSVDRDPTDNQIELEGLNPEGQRVRVTVDTTMASILHERPLSEQD
jgi:hypothetical protein